MDETKSNLKENAISDEYCVETSHSIRSNKTPRANKNQNTNQALSKIKFVQQLPKLKIVSKSNGLLNPVILEMDKTENDKTKSRKSYKKIKYILNDMISELKGMLMNTFLVTVGGIMFHVMGGIRLIDTDYED